MKTKWIITIAVAVLLVSAGAFFYVRYKHAHRPGNDEIVQFITYFNNQLQAGHTDSAKACFETKLKRKTVLRWINVLSGKTGLNGKSAAQFKLSMDPTNSNVRVVDDEYAEATIGINFTADASAAQQSSVIIRVHKTGAHEFKIANINTVLFVKDYQGYLANLHSVEHIPDLTVYSPITLAAFKTAEQLKAKYDSVLWFDHVNQQTWFYVAKGTVNKEFWFSDESKSKNIQTFKIGLVDPSLKEIIPAEYDLIHNVNGAVDGLIEVENNGKKGFFDLQGKNVVPAEYDELYPLSDDENVAVLLKGSDYYYLTKNLSITDKVSNFKIAEVLPHIKNYGRSYTLSDSTSTDVMEYNSHNDHNSLLFPPSYLVDWAILPAYIDFENPLRKLNASGDGEEEEETNLSYAIDFEGQKNKEENWFVAAFHSIVDDYIGGRGGLYQSKNLLVVDKRKNKVFGYKAEISFGEGEGGVLSGRCSDNALRAISDSLLEYKTTASVVMQLLNGDVIEEAPYYTYLYVKNSKLVSLPNERIFGFTKYVKMDESYLTGCYVIGDKTIDHVTTEMLQYAKNEIYASYQYQFKSDKWTQIFEGHFGRYDSPKHAVVDDSLTAIDKYNIAWINRKLMAKKPVNAYAAR